MMNHIVDQAHSKMVNFYCAWFCPYAQRAWLALEFHQIPYDYIESLTVNKKQEEGLNGYTKNPRLLELNPKGLVPTLEVQPELVEVLNESGKNMLTKKNDAWVMKESIDSMVFLDKVAMATQSEVKSLIPDHGQDYTSSEFLADANTFNQKICSTFYKILMKPTMEEQKEAFALFASGISDFLQKVREGGYYDSETPTIVDFTVIPWLLRIPLLLHYREMSQLDDYLNVDDDKKLNEYLSRIRSLEAVQKTLWKDDKDLIAVYKRYADGSAKSQVGQAVLSGKNAHDI